MNTSIGWATLDVIPSVRGIRGELDKQTGPALAAAGAKGGRVFGDTAGREASARFGSVMRKGVKVAAIGLAAAGAAAFKFGGDALEEAREAQKVGAQTRAAIKSTGKAAKVTAGDIGKLTGRLSDMAGIDDELIQSGANVLLTFKNIRNEAGDSNKIFDQATESALNMSVALDQDLKSASLQVGKALNDPVKGMTALGRAGVQFSEDQKAAVKAMVESGDTLGAQKIILKELDAQFAGSARAQATEADKLGVAYGNLKEDIGTALIPVMDDLAVFLRRKGIPAARDFFGWIRDEGVPAIKTAKEEIEPVVGVVKDLAAAFGDLPTGGKLASLTGVIAGGLVVKHKVAGIFDRGGIANPMFVTVTNPGFGGGTGGKGTSIGKGVAKALPPVLIIGGLAYAVDSLILDPARKGATRLEPTRQGFDSTLGSIEGVENKAKGFGRELDLIGAKKVEPKFAVPGLAEGRAGLAEFIRLQIDAGKPVTPYINTTSIERALGLLRTMNAEIRADAVPTAGVDNGVGYQHGGVNPRAGVNINIENMQPHDYNDFQRITQRKVQRAGLGGRP